MLAGANLIFQVRDEAQRAKARGSKGRRRGWDSWRWRSYPAHPLESVGERGQGRIPAAKRFSCTLEAPEGLSWNLLGATFGGGHDRVCGTVYRLL